MEKMKIVEKRLYNLKQEELAIESLEVKLLELQLEKKEVGASAINYDSIKVSPTYKINDGVIDKHIELMQKIEDVEMQIEIKKRRVELMKKAINNLTYIQRKIIELKYFEKIKVSNICDNLHTTYKTVIKEKDKALKSLCVAIF